MTKRRKHYGVDVGMGITKTGIGLGGGAMALSGMGGSAATSASAGLANMGAMLPAAGSIGGAGLVLGGVSQWRKFTKRRR